MTIAQKIRSKANLLRAVAVICLVPSVAFLWIIFDEGRVRSIAIGLCNLIVMLAISTPLLRGTNERIGIKGMIVIVLALATSLACLAFIPGTARI